MPSPTFRPGSRATAPALRELGTLLEPLVAQSPLADARAHRDTQEGESDAPATTCMRRAGTDLGRAPATRLDAEAHRRETRL
jgi:hypothetical protein